MAPSLIETTLTSERTESNTGMTKKIKTPITQNDAGLSTRTPLQAICQGSVSLPAIPNHPSFLAHRAWMLGHMAGAFRVFARKGYTEGMSGHISVRDPEFPHAFWTNPLGRHFGLLKASDMIMVNYEGEPIAGNFSRPANAAGFLIHSAVHKARPDVTAACHTHSPYGKAYSTFVKPLEMINQDVCYFYGKAQAVYEDFGGVVLTEKEGQRLAAALGPEGKGMILRNHGLLTVGSTVDEAAYLYTLMERSCEVQLLADAAALATGRDKVMVPDEACKFTFEMGADAESLYHEFQPDLDFERELATSTFEDHTGGLENFNA